SLRLQDALALEGCDRADEVALAPGEIVEQLALARRGAGPDVVQARTPHPPGQDEVGGSLDDPSAGSRPSRRDVRSCGHGPEDTPLDCVVHYPVYCGPCGPFASPHHDNQGSRGMGMRLEGKTALVAGATSNIGR